MSNLHFKVYQPYPSSELASAASKHLERVIDTLAANFSVFIRRQVFIEELHDFAAGVEWYVGARFTVSSEGEPGKRFTAITLNDGFTLLGISCDE